MHQLPICGNCNYSNNGHCAMNLLNMIGREMKCMKYIRHTEPVVSINHLPQYITNDLKERVYIIKFSEPISKISNDEIDENKELIPQLPKFKQKRIEFGENK